MNKIENIAAQFEALIPAIKANYINRARNTFKYLDEALEGDWSYNNRRRKIQASRYDPLYNAMANITHLIEREKSTSGNYISDPKVLGLDEARLEKFSTEHAEGQIASFTMKLNKKLVDLTDVKLTSIDCGRFEFTISGKLGDRKVFVEQQVVFKVSNKGTPFCQWPARIYVDGKFTSEAAFKKLAA